MATLKKVQTYIKLHYEWKLDNYELLQQCKMRLAEQKFEMLVGGPPGVRSKWLVGFKPADTVEFYFKLLEKSGDEPKIRTRVSVGCRTADGFEFILKKVENVTAENEEFTIDIGWRTEESAPEFRNTLWEENSALVFTFKMKLRANTPSGESQHPEQCLEKLERTSLELLHRNYSELLEDSQSHDVKIMCSDGVEFGAHKMILSARNPVFACMFGSTFSENHTGLVNVDDVPGKVMKIILHYIYTGELLAEWSLPDTIAEFMYAAEKYQLSEVLEMLDNVLGKDDFYTTGNLITLLNLAIKLSLKNAEKKLTERTIELTNKATSGQDILAIYGNG